MEETLLVRWPENGEGQFEETEEGVVGELKKLSYIALPMVVTTVSQNFLRVVCMMMIGHLGELPLSGASIATSLTNVTGFSLLKTGVHTEVTKEVTTANAGAEKARKGARFGMASALETLCGQAYGAGQHQKLGSYTYGALISLLLVCLPISLLWLFMENLLVVIGQDPLISHEAGYYSIWLIGTLYPFAILQLLVRYLLTQSLIYPMLLSSVAVLILHVPLSWALIFKFGLGTAGAALAIGLSYWLNVILLWLYVKYSSSCENTRLSFSNDVFASIPEFFRFGIPSATMICLEWWSYELIVLLSGLLPNPQLETSVLSICLTIATVHYYVPYSFGAAGSTRISNALGGGKPKAAKRAAWVVTTIAAAEVIIASIILFSCRAILGYAFGDEKDIVNYVKVMTPLLCFSIMVDSLQAIFCGVARGTGWQHLGAYANLVAYYLVGIPLACILGFVVHWRGKGLWIGLTTGTMVQVALLIVITYFTDWKKQATKARERIFKERISGNN